MNHLLTSWKSTLQSILTVLIGLSGVAWPAGLLTPKQALWMAIVPSVAKIVLGAVQQDAGVTLATTPQSPVTPIAVASHEQPDDPAATPVNK